MTFLSLGGSRKLKKALGAAEEQILSLKVQVRALEDSSKRLTAELAESKRTHITPASDKVKVEQSTCIIEEKKSMDEGASIDKEKEVKIEEPSSSSGADKDVSLQRAVDDLTAHNKELQATVASLTEDKSKLEARLEKAEAAPVDLRKTIDELTLLNERLQTDIGALTQENIKLVATVEEKVESSPEEATPCKSNAREHQNILTPDLNSSKKLSFEGEDKLDGKVEMESARQTHSSNNEQVVEGDPQSIINELKANIASLSNERDKLASNLAKEKTKIQMRKVEAKGRRQQLKNKLAVMSKQLKEDFGDDFGENSVVSEEKESDTDKDDTKDDVDNDEPLDLNISIVSENSD